MEGEIPKGQTDLIRRVKTLARWIFEAKRIVIFTGAGISTESNLPDFRGPDGIWTRQEKGLPTKPIDFSLAEPNAGHRVIFELQEMGKLTFLISQNVDNLHLKSGINPEILAELHGNVTRQRCQNCGFTMDNHGDTECPLCGGKLKSSVVGFGQAMPQKEMSEAYRYSQDCDLFIVAGSSLVVFPAADMPEVAFRGGARLAIVNQGDTPLDDIVHLRFRESTGVVLTQVLVELKKLKS